MENQVINNANALRLFFTEEVFVVEDLRMEKQGSIQHEIKPVSISTAEKETEKLPQITQASVTASDAGPISTVRLPNTSVPVESETPAAPVFDYLGGNQKSVLILVNDHEHPVSTPEGRELLRKIVKAIDLTTPDFALLNYARYQGTAFKVIQQFFKPAIMLSFGVECGHLKLDLSWQNEIILHENVRMIFAPHLHLLDNDLVAKKMLWGHLQKIR